MAEEVSEKLRQEMNATFALKTVTDPQIAAINKKLKAKTATQADVSDYSARLGELLRDTLREVLTPEALPNETLYYNILRDTVDVMLKNAHRQVNQAAIEAQKAIDEAGGLGLNAVEAPYPQRRVNDLLYKAGAPGTPFDSAMKLLDQPVITLTQAFHDDHIRYNADKRFRAGLAPKIIRTAAPKCCEWCSSLEGVYDYEDVKDTGNDVFRRHERCRCTVEYVCDGKRSDVWSKKLYEADEETLEKRSAYGVKKKRQKRSEDQKRQEWIAESKRNREKYLKTIATSPETLQLRSEYRLAIDGHSDIIKNKGSDLFSPEAKKRMYQNERIISGNNYETAILYDKSGNTIFKQKGSHNEVNFTKKQIKQMRGGIITHNHPNDEGFSADDINLLRVTGVTEVRACTRRGTYVIQRGENWSEELYDKDTIEKQLNQSIDAAYSKYQDIAAQNGKSFAYYISEAEEEAMQNFAEKNNLAFRWEPKKE